MDLAMTNNPKNPHAVALGRKGGTAKVSKGLAMATTEQRRTNAIKAWETRRAKRRAAQTPLSTR